MGVSVVIPARDAAATVGRAIASALRQGAVVGEVMVAIGPDDRTPAEATPTWRAVQELASGDARVRAVANPGGTTPHGLNAAIGASAADVIVRLDAHAVLPDGYVRRALEVLEATGAGNVGGRQVPVGDGVVQRGIAAAMRSRVGSGGAAYRGATEGGPVDTVYLGVFRRAALEAVGGFDERMTRNQDYELNLRLRQAGWVVHYDPELAVEYRPRASFAALARQYRDYGRWRRMSARLHPGTLRLRQALPPVVVVAGAALAVATVLGLLPAAVLGAVTLLYVAAVALDTRSHATTVSAWAAAIGAVAIMHAAWGIGFLLGPPAGARDRDRGGIQE